MQTPKRQRGPLPPRLDLEDTLLVNRVRAIARRWHAEMEAELDAAPIDPKRMAMLEFEIAANRMMTDQDRLNVRRGSETVGTR